MNATIDPNLYGVEPEEVGGCACGARFYDTEDLYAHECELPDPCHATASRGGVFASEPVATLVPGVPGSLDLPGPDLEELRKRTFIFERDDGALNVHPPVPGPAKCCDGRMVYFFINRDGVTRCSSCDAKR